MQQSYIKESIISLKLLHNFIDIVLQYGRSPVNLQHILERVFLKTKEIQPTPQMFPYKN